MRILAFFLGLAGTLPFVGVAAASWLAPVNWHSMVVHALLVYTALIVSFLGGVHWGVAFSRPDFARRHLLWGMASAAMAWGVVLLPWAVVSLSAFILLLLLSWRVDRSWLVYVGLPLKYATLRTMLTAVAALSLLLVIGSYGRAGIL